MDNIPWERIPDEKFSLKRIFRSYGGFGTGKPREVRDDGSKLLWSNASQNFGHMRTEVRFI